MRGFHDQTWVTSAVCDADVPKALSLCCSLKRAYTTRKTSIIASPKLSPDLRQSLVHGFDFVFYIEEHRKPAQMKLEDYAKLFSFAALHGFEKCVYLSPTMLVLKNSDEIFSNPADQVVNLQDASDTSVFLFKPSVHRFEELITGMKYMGSDDNSIGKYFHELTRSTEEATRFMHGKYNVVMKNGKTITGYEKDISIVNLIDYPDEENISILENEGVLGNCVAKHWLNIQHDYVQPLISKRDQICAPGNHLEPKFNKEPIAIIGMSCRYPGSNNLEEFWKLLFNAEDGTCSPPPFRWPEYVGDDRKTNAGFLKCPVDNFDGKFFGISPKEILCMDPQYRILLELVWEALEDACIDPQTLRGTQGSVFLGSWKNDYKELLTQSGNKEWFRNYMGNSIGGGAARISFLLGMIGPNIATESGCSSSMVALHLACRSLQNGETSLALACGVNLLLIPYEEHLQMVTSPDGRCKTFSADANGCARGEGAGVLVLKRLSDALRDGDHIWGLIRGSAVNEEGTSPSMGTPTVHCESTVMKNALRDANISSEQVSYVETHGTGTVVGDPMEVAAIAEAYNTPKRQEPLIIGSVKTNVGHTESCSGITGIIKVILAMQHEVIPAHINFTKLNPAIDLKAVPAIIPLDRVDWKQLNGKLRIAGVSSFGITGGDTHVIIQEPPKSPISKVLAVSDTERPMHILKLSAKSDEAMSLLLKRFQGAMETRNDDIADICYSANTGRANFPIRAAIVARSKEGISAAIQEEKYMKGAVASEKMDKICFLFTGQGSQYPGMSKQLYDTSPVFRMHFEYCEKILKQTYNLNITQVLWPKSANPSDEINTTIYSQTAIFCVEYALLKLWESWGVKPDFVLGHSLGEFAAAVGAGILSVEDALKLVAERSRLIDRLPRGKMLVIKAAQYQVDNVMNHFANGNKEKILEYAAINSDEQTVVSGDSEVIVEFSKFCTNNKLKCIILAASHAFHSAHMDPILTDYKIVAGTVKKQEESKCLYISGVTGDLISGNEMDAEYWVKHTRNEVNFLKASKKAVDLGCKIFIEVGPQPVLSALTMMNNQNNLLCLPSLKKNENEWTTLLNSLGKLYVKGFEIDWNGLDQFHLRKKVRLPHYPFSGKKYWPEMMNTNGNTIHPLIGAIIPNASSIKLFESTLSLKSHEFIKEHKIGRHVIFPGAGYVEMCMAAGVAVMQGSSTNLPRPSLPMKVENLDITSALTLDESKPVKIQTVLEFSGTNGNNNQDYDASVRIFHQNDSNSSWLCHANATFAQITSTEEQTPCFDKRLFQGKISTPGNEAMSEGLYVKLNQLGFKFGPLFKSIERIWQDEGISNNIVAKIKVPAGESDYIQYIIHPIIIDAMLQAFIMQKMIGNEAKPKFCVPIKIGKFIWLSNASDGANSDMYIQVQRISTGSKGASADQSSSALLLDSTGKILAVISGVEFIDTSVKVMESVWEQETKQMSDLFQETWRPTTSTLQHLANLKFCPVTKETMEIVHLGNNLEELNCRPDLDEIRSKLDKLVFLNILSATLALGWKPLLNDVFDESDLFKELKIKHEFRKQFGYFLRVFGQEGILEKVGKGTWRVNRLPPAAHEIDMDLSSSVYTKDLVAKFKSTLLVSKVGQNLQEILRGSQSALSILFPSEADKGNGSSADGLYREYSKLCNNKTMLRTQTLNWLQKYQKQALEAGHTGFVLRILEIGGGTGGYTEPFLEILEESRIEYEYTYTDISSAFFVAAEKRFLKYSQKMKFKVLDIEEDPIDQGFVPSSYDLVMASEVLHATRNLRESVQNVSSLLKENGHFDLIEMTRDIRHGTFMFGLLDGFWRFEDFDIRPDHCVISKDSWVKVLENCGFNVAGAFQYANNQHAFIKSRKYTLSKPNQICSADRKIWLVFHNQQNKISQFITEIIPKLAQNRTVISVTRGNRFEKINQNSYSIRPNNENDFNDMLKIALGEPGNLEGIVYAWALEETNKSTVDVLLPYFLLTKSLLQMQTNQAKLNPRLYLLTSETVPVEYCDMPNPFSSLLWGFTKSMINESCQTYYKCIDVGKPTENEEMIQIFYELWKPEKETQVTFRGNLRYVAALISHKPSLKNLELPVGVEKFQLVLPETNSISDLRFGPLTNNITLESNQVEIQVKASALNFYDVFSVLKPSDDFKDSKDIGLDFSGVVSRIGHGVSKWSAGDAVYGISQNAGAMPSHIKLHEEAVFSIPKDMTFCEASTLPVVMATGIYCLLDVAKITSSDTVLIHTASGGVGLAAIQICKFIGCTIIATAGSKRKQNYLKSLGIQHIFNSRNTLFEKQIMKVTNGRGVDVVLNSLTGEGFKEATLNVCAEGARFVEMSKLSIWHHEDVRRLRPDVKYTIVDILKAWKAEGRRLLTKLEELTMKNVVKSIPFVRFDGTNIREALNYIQEAKHIGKVVCAMPEIKQRRDGGTRICTQMFSKNASYLITGGLGGIGFEICKWMVKNGAKYVLLAGRNPPNQNMLKQIAELNSEFQAKVQAVQLDVSSFEQCEMLFKSKIQEMNFPEVRGVMHAAGTLNDGLIQNHTWDSLSSTLKCKVDGTLNLHELTKDNSKLEHFVLFSSMVSLFGSHGQSNHAAGNNFEDVFAHYRNSIGLPGTSINWGQWGQVGVATEFDLPGIKPLTTRQCISGLEYALKSQQTQLGVIGVESFDILCKLNPHVKCLLDGKQSGVIAGPAESNSNFLSAEVPDVWNQLECAESMERKEEIVKEKLRSILRNILKLEESDVIDDNINFHELGVDSLMSIEIRNELQSMIGSRAILNSNILRDSSNVKSLAETLLKLLQNTNAIAVKELTQAEISQLIRNECLLPENITAQSHQKSVKHENISQAFLTGATGTLGAYLLAELSQNTQVSRVTCLIRSKWGQTPEQLLEKILKERDLLSKVDMRKVRCVNGNVALPQLGIEPQLWDELCDSVDAVFHCAALVQHTERFSRDHDSLNSIKSVNIGGLKNLLQFCFTGQKLKHIYNASSLIAATLDEDGNLSEGFPGIQDFDGVTTFAYPITKFVGDVLMREAVTKRGIPGKCFRFPHISGESMTGRFVLERNHFMLRFLFILQHGMMPNNPVLVPALPVDICAKISVALFFNPNAPSDIYNITNSKPDTDPEFAEIAKRFGYDLKIVDSAVFANNVRKTSAGNSPLTAFKELYSNNDHVPSIFSNLPVLKQISAHDDSRERFFFSKKLLRFMPEFYKTGHGQISTMEFIYNDLLFAEKQGWLDKYPL